MKTPGLLDTISSTIKVGLNVIQSAGRTIQVGSDILELNAKASLIESCEEFESTFSTDSITKAKATLEAMRTL